MIKIVSLTLIVAVLFSCKAKVKTDTGAEQELIRLNNLYDSALIHHDTGVLKRLYAEEFVYTNPDGNLLTKEQQVNSITTSEMKWETGKSEDVKTMIYNNAAVMTGLFRANGNYRGNPVTINERYTALWIKKADGWKMVAEQGNVIK